MPQPSRSTPTVHREPTRGETSSAYARTSQPWATPADEVRSAWKTPERGLSTDEVEERRKTFGPNQLREIQRRSVWKILWDQVKSLIMVLLLGAMGVAFVSGQIVEAIAVAAVIVINTAIGFVTEWSAVRSIEALQELGEITARVRRNGRERRIHAEQLVPGDLLHLKQGDTVAADVRLLTVDNLQVDESALTGESVPVPKQSEAVEAETELADRRSMAYKGTAVTQGEGWGVVVATGMHTELGEISEMVETAEVGETPLERKIDRLGRRLVGLTLAIAVGVMVAGVLGGRSLVLMIETGIALAVAAVPEGLPIVATVALSYGAWRMLRRNALVRHLSSVETLGSTTVICTDKTGTLTENRMTARRAVLPDGPDTAAVVELGDDESLPSSPPFRAMVKVGVLCNDARQGTDDQEEQGDPLEVALLDLGDRCDLTRADLEAEAPRVRGVPFDRDTKMMATVHEEEGAYREAVKGAPEAVLDVCTQVQVDGEVQPLDEAARDEWKRASESMAEDGLRVLAFARKTVRNPEADPYHDLELLGLVGLLDPPRQDVRSVIDRCKAAGIRVIMVTGDHPSTARYVANAVHLDDGEGTILQGHEIPAPEEADRDAVRRMLDATVYARVSPKQKLDLVDLHQEAGAIVAMTGDGVNDAPALRSADIGVAMGERGTDVAQEAADMILQDDAFSTIVSAVEQGRVIFNNIRKFTVYLLSGNVGEILAVGAAAAVGAPLPLLPLQILYLNMINDVFPALALGVGPGPAAVMERPPRDPAEDVLERRHWGQIGGYGLVLAATMLGVFGTALGPLGMPLEEAVTLSFLTISTSRLLHVFNMHDPGSGLAINEISRNPFVWGALLVCIALLLVAVYVPALAEVLSLVPPSPAGWWLVGGASFVPLVAGQAYLAWRARS